MTFVDLHQTSAVARFLHYAFPASIFTYFFAAQMISFCALQTMSANMLAYRVHRGAIITIMLVAAGTYVSVAAMVARSSRARHRSVEQLADTRSQLMEIIISTIKYIQEADWNPDQDRMFYLVASFLTLGIETLLFTENQLPIWYPYYGTWIIAILGELILIIVANAFHNPTSPGDVGSALIHGLRLSMFIILCFLYFGRESKDTGHRGSDPERQSLLRRRVRHNTANPEHTREGILHDRDTSHESDTSKDSDSVSDHEWLESRRQGKEKLLKRLKHDGNWLTYVKGFSIFLPYAWPMNNKTLQFRAVLVAACLLMSNALNILVPRQMGVMVDNLAEYVKGDFTRNIWFPVLAYAVLLFLNGGACIGWLRLWLWRPLEQHSYKAFSTATHSHIMNLSADFHDSKVTADLMLAANGGKTVTALLDTIFFQVVPMFIDLVIAFGYLWSLFGPFMGLVLATTFFSYLYITLKLVSRRAGQWRQYILLHRKEYTTGQQSFEAWNTASLFNMIPYEQQRYEDGVQANMQAKGVFDLSSQSMNAAQGLTMTCGLIGGLYLAVFQVAKEGRSIGQLTTFLVYWAQLQSPISFFSSVFNNISDRLMSAEQLLDLFHMTPTVADRPNAKQLVLGKGEIKFDRVCFAYNERKSTLKNVSFIVPAGKTLALVGETGSGKSTILKLLERFYDINSGSISIDKQDIRDVTIQSLRSKIGVVPQEPMLFHDSIMNNIRYSKMTASDEEVYDACKASAVHEKIMGFPNGYNTKIGDRGMKLSGGEKQRVAIARAILKNPEIILLDEATSAVDTDTEHMIQQKLRMMCQDRTTIIVAHRLSTIMYADRILVIKDGEIIEEGTHSELIDARGKYNDLWQKQALVKTCNEASEPEELDVEGASSSRSLDANKFVLARTGAASTTTRYRRSRNEATTGSTEEREPEGGSVNRREVGDTL